MSIIKRIKRIKELRNIIRDLDKEIESLLREAKIKGYSYDNHFDKILYLDNLMNKRSDLYIERMDLIWFFR